MFKPELVLPPLFSAVLLTAWILYLIRRLRHDLERQSAESNAKAEALHRETMARLEAEIAQVEAEYAARAAARAAAFELVLALDAEADADDILDRVGEFLDELNEYARAGGGAGLTLDTLRSTAEPGRVTLRLVPTDPRCVSEQRQVVEAKSRTLAGVSAVEFAAA